MPSGIGTMHGNLEKLLRLPFDQFSRYYLTAVVLEKIQDRHGRLKILDVGGRNTILGEFSPQHDIHILDIRTPDNRDEITLLKKNKYIVGDILGDEPRDGTFDITVSMDMLGHIMCEDRVRVVERMLGICRLGCIIGAPFDTPLTAAVERQLNEYHKELKGEEHPWLKEHRESGPLPNEGELEGHLKKHGYPYVKVPNNNIYLWTMMQHLIFTAYTFGIDIEGVYKIYNRLFVEGKLADARLPANRYIYFIFKGNNVIDVTDIKFPEPGPEHEVNALELVNEIFKRISMHIRMKEDKAYVLWHITGSGTGSCLRGAGGARWPGP